MEIEGINFIAVAAAWIVNCAVGALWYSPAGFAKQWEKYTGIDLMKIPEQEATKTLVWVVVAAFGQAVVLAIILNSLNLTDLRTALLAGIVLWFGFIAATTVGVTLYSRRSWGYWWLNASYFLLVVLINTIILTVWK